MSNQRQQPNLVVMIGGSGSNLQAIIDAIHQDCLAMSLKAVISHRPNVLGLERAKTANVPSIVVDHTQYETRHHFEKALNQALAPFQPDFIALAGFMRILTPEFVTTWQNRLINIHPSLLPKFKGLNTHQRALDANEKEHGATVHLVTPELDDGPIIAQKKIPILTTDTETSLKNRVLKIEHELYPEALQKLAKNFSISKTCAILQEGSS